MSELFAAYNDRLRSLTEHAEYQEDGIAVSPEFRRLTKGRISASLVPWRIFDVKAESRLT